MMIALLVCVILMCESGFDDHLCIFVNIQCCVWQNGWTPLYAASNKGKVDVVRLLINAKANLETGTNKVSVLRAVLPPSKCLHEWDVLGWEM
jgi:ankyrin repeat protein